MAETRDPLIECRLRCERAAEHIREFESRVARYIEAEKKKVFGAVDPDKKIATIGYTEKPEGPPLILSVLVGETVYNLRSTLDYLVFLLAVNDSGKPQKNTQFVICDSEGNFKSKVARHFKGISVENIRRLEQYQPFNSCVWMKILRDISNPDKHRHLIATSGDGEHVLTVGRTENGFETKFEARIEVCFVNGQPVLSILRELHTHVAETIDAFKGCFTVGSE